MRVKNDALGHYIFLAGAKWENLESSVAGLSEM
jgi:hypothetical protein